MMSANKKNGGQVFLTVSYTLSKMVALMILHPFENRNIR